MLFHTLKNHHLTFFQPYLSDKEKKIAGAQTAFLLECTGDGLVPVVWLVGHLLLLDPPVQPLRALQSRFRILHKEAQRCFTQVPLLLVF